LPRRITDEADFGDDAEFQKVFAFHAASPGCAKRGVWRPRRRKITVAQTAASAFAQNKLLAVFGEVGDEFAFLRILGGSDSANSSFLAKSISIAVSPARCGAMDVLPVLLPNIAWRWEFRSPRRPRPQLFLQPEPRARPEPDQRATRNLDDQIFSGVAVHALALAAFADRRDEARNVILSDEISGRGRPAKSRCRRARRCRHSARLCDVSLAMERETAFATMPACG